MATALKVDRKRIPALVWGPRGQRRRVKPKTTVKRTLQSEGRAVNFNDRKVADQTAVNRERDGESWSLPHVPCLTLEDIDQ